MVSGCHVQKHWAIRTSQDHLVAIHLDSGCSMLSTLYDRFSSHYSKTFSFDVREFCIPCVKAKSLSVTLQHHPSTLFCNVVSPRLAVTRSVYCFRLCKFTPCAWPSRILQLNSIVCSTQWSHLCTICEWTWHGLSQRLDRGIRQFSKYFQPSPYHIHQQRLTQLDWQAIFFPKRREAKLPPNWHWSLNSSHGQADLCLQHHEAHYTIGWLHIC